MKSRTASAAGLLLLGLMLGACSKGSTAMTPQAYFTELATITSEANEKQATMQVEASAAYEAAADPEAELEVVRGSIDDVTQLSDELIASVEALTPPEVAAPAHEALLSSMHDVNAKAKSFIPKFAEVTPEGIEALVEELGTTMDPATAASEDACNELQSVAEAESVDVELECSGPASS